MGNYIFNTYSFNNLSNLECSIYTTTIVIVSYFFMRSLYISRKTAKFMAEAKSIRTQRDEKIENYVSKNSTRISKERIIEIISLNATNLLESIKRREISVVESYLAYSLRAATIGKEYGLLTDVDFQNGLCKAEEYQNILDKNGSVCFKKFPLFGLPISVKDHIGVKDLLNTLGYIRSGTTIDTEDSLIVEILRSKGAIPFVKTNVPQGLMSFDSSNNLWGKCSNPWNPNKISGGSSGGEASLVNSRCSPVGIASDLGGSIRIPSVLNGCYGFKPTSSRISKKGIIISAGTQYSGLPVLSGSLGPICNSPDDILLLSKNLFGEFSEDYYVYNKPFDNDLFMSENSNIKIGYFFETNTIQCTESIEKGVLDVVRELQTKGYNLVKFPYNVIEELVSTGFLLMFSSGAADGLIKGLDGEPACEYYKNLLFIYDKPRWLIVFLSKILSLFGEKRSALSLINLKKLNTQEFIETTRKFLELKSKFIEYLKKENIKGLLCPVIPVPCISHGTAQEYPFYNDFNFITAFADLPSCTIPLYLNENTEFKSKFGRDKFSKFQAREAKESKGIPIGVQIATLPLHDELALKIMKDIASIFQFELKEGMKIVDIISDRK